jgi:hypothetical protein
MNRYMEDISLHILDIAENSINAEATVIRIRIAEDSSNDLFTVTIEDNGKGMTEEFMQKILDPFCTTRTTRNVGLGLSLLTQAARETGGDILIQSVPDKGTLVRADFRPSHIDMKPLGNITDTILTLIAGNPQLDFLFSYMREGKSYCLDTLQIRAALGEVPINSAEVLLAIRSDLCEGLQQVQETRNVPL